MFDKLKSHQFLFEELVKRDFKKKYKRTVLGMAWSILAPLLQLAVMTLVFTQFFGRNTPHYMIYIFCGNLIFSFFSDAMRASLPRSTCPSICSCFHETSRLSSTLG